MNRRSVAPVGAPGRRRCLTVVHTPRPLGIQQQLLCIADIVLRLGQDGVYIGKAANSFFDLISKMSNLERGGGDGELQHLVGHGLNTVRVCTLL